MVWLISGGKRYERSHLIRNPVVKVYQNPQAEAWGYTDKACLRRLSSKTTFHNRIWYQTGDTGKRKELT